MGRPKKNKMPKEPRTHFRSRVENRVGKSIVVVIPDEMLELIRCAQIIERSELGCEINIADFTAKALIDRIGRILGTRFATKLYRAFFNGIGAIKPDVELPEVRQPDDLNIFITNKKDECKT